MKTLTTNNKTTKVNVINGAKVYIGWTDFGKVKGIKAFINEIKVSYKTSNDDFRELTVKENGACDYYELEAFLAHFFKHYAVGSCEEGTLDCIAQTIYRLISHYHENKNIAEMVLGSVSSFGLPMHSRLNQDDDFVISKRLHRAPVLHSTYYH